MKSTPTMEAVCREDELFNNDRNYAGRSGEERLRRRRRQRRMKGERRGRKEEEKQNEGDREDNILKNTRGGGVRGTEGDRDEDKAQRGGGVGGDRNRR